MRNLFNFIIRNGHLLLAILLIAFSFYLVFSHNSFQRSVYLSSSNSVAGWFYNVTNGVHSFVNLKKQNQQLLEQNAGLQNELYQLKAYIDSRYFDADSLELNVFATDSIAKSQFNFIPAEVVSITYSCVNNYMTINRGSANGIKPDMGVISQRGVVGVVSTVSSNFSIVIPIINPLFRLSGKLRNSDNYGSVSWDGKNIGVAQLEEMPKHETFEIGDTVLTSFSRIFPKQLIIGFVTGLGESGDDNFNKLNFKLATDFHSLQEVLVIEDRLLEEQKRLENSLER